MFDDRLSGRERRNIRPGRGLPTEFVMQDGEAVAAQTEPAVLLRNAEAEPSQGSGLGPQLPIERIFAVDEGVHGQTAALLRQHAGDAFPQCVEGRLVQ